MTNLITQAQRDKGEASREKPGGFATRASTGSGDVPADGFERLYNLSEPRSYFRALQAFEYRVPAFAQPIFTRCVEALKSLRGREEITVLDVCCGYGVNGALLNYELTLGDLYDHYARREDRHFSPSELISIDRRVFSRRRKPCQTASVIGIDVADRALSYAGQISFIERGFAVDLEQESPKTEMIPALQDADLITVTGGISYVGEKTFERLLRARPKRAKPWIAFFPLRTTRFTGLIRAFARFGLLTEKWRERTFPQRRFRNDEERRRALYRLAEMGLDVSGKEAAGYLHTAFHLARPESEIERVALRRLVGPGWQPPRN